MSQIYPSLIGAGGGEARSALPDAPVVPQRKRNRRTRRAAARALRRIADRMESTT
jgi:hypothetical protein